MTDWCARLRKYGARRSPPIFVKSRVIITSSRVAPHALGGNGAAMTRPLVRSRRTLASVRGMGLLSKSLSSRGIVSPSLARPTVLPIDSIDSIQLESAELLVHQNFLK